MVSIRSNSQTAESTTSICTHNCMQILKTLGSHRHSIVQERQTITQKERTKQTIYDPRFDHCFTKRGGTPPFNSLFNYSHIKVKKFCCLLIMSLAVLSEIQSIILNKTLLNNCACLDTCLTL